MNFISRLSLIFYISFFSYLYSDHEERKTQLLSTYETGLFDEGAAEITVFDPASGHILFVNAYQNSVTALDLFEDGTVSFAFEVSVEAQVPGGTANCLAVHDGLVAVAVEDGVFGAPGKVAFYSAFDGSVVGVPVEVGVMPDNVQFSPDGSKVITADEGEPNDDYTEDPLGSISIIDIVNGSPALTATVLTFASFEGTESALALEGGRVFGQIQVPDPAGSEWVVLGNEVWTDLGSHTSTSTASGLFFSEYAEGSSSNKYLEIYNGTGADVDLSGFSISTCNNGCDVEGEFDYPDNVTFAAGTIIANGDVFVMAHPNSDPPILAEADDISFSYFSNGDDFQALTLAGATANQYTIIDKIGDFGDDPGSGWTVAGVENATQNNTLKRNSSITSGSLDWSNSSSLAYSSTPSTLSQDLEPEYVAVSPNSETAYVVCQENNILAVVDLATSSVTALKGLGYKDHSLPGNGYDPTDQNDGQINIAPQPTLGMYQPDAMVSHTIAGATYVFTANEGDARDYDGYSEETRVEDLTLDPTAYPNAATLQLETALGRLKTTTSQGDMDGDGDVDQIYSYGARSFSIWDAAGNLVWDSGDLIEEVLADFYMTGYPGVDYSFDSRSDDKGPEPEAVEVATVDDQVFCFVGLERASGVMVFNVTDPTMPFVESYEPPSFLNTPVEGNDRETAPECVEFVAAADNITGKDLVIVANELTGSISINEFSPTGFVDSTPNEVTFSGPDVAVPGDIVEVSVGVMVSNQPVYSFQMEGLHLPHTAPVAVDFSGTLVEAGGWEATHSIEMGMIHIAAAGSMPLEVGTEGILVKIHFEVQGHEDLGGLFEVQFNEILFNEEYNNINVSALEIALFQLGDASLNADVTAFDAALVLEHVAELGTLSDIQLEVADASMDMSLSAMDASLILQHVVGLINLMDSEPTVATAAGDMNIQDGVFVPNSQLSVPIHISDDQNIYSFKIEMEYDETAMEFEEIEMSDMENSFIIKSKDESGLLQIVGARTLADNIEGIFGNIVFNVLDTNIEELEVSVNYLRWNENQASENVLVATFTNSTLSIDETAPQQFALYDNYPNPFNPSTRLSYDIAEQVRVNITIFDAVGREVIKLFDGIQNPGFQNVVWNGKDQFGQNVPAGIYIYRMNAGGFISTKKMVLLK